MNASELVALLGGRDLRPKPAGGAGKWQALCPAHEDRKPSLSISEGLDGRTLVFCHAGCELESVLSALGLRAADLFEQSNGDRRRHVGDRDRGPGEGPLVSAAAILEASRVDLVALIRDGMPEPAYVPGCAPWLLAGKRYLMPAAAGTGKSLVALIVAVESVKAGGTVAILDVENGADEYARRLADILAARDPDGALAHGCQQRLHYHAWPQLSLTWTTEDWSDALVGTDLAIFDSSRLALSGVGLAEDKADDYGKFVNALILPLIKAGAATIMLDNTGHGEQDRARGTSSKADLNEVVYALKAGAPFDRDRAGHLRLIRTRSRFSGLPRELHVHLGANTYTAPVDVSPDGDRQERPFRPTVLMERVSLALQAEPGLSKRSIRTAVSGRAEWIDLALEILIAEGYVEDRRDGKANRHHSIKPYLEASAEADRVPVSDRVPTVSRTRLQTVSRVPLPRGDTVTEQNGGHTEGNRVPDLTSHLIANEQDVDEGADEFVSEVLRRHEGKRS
jgi:hypothetical protein